MRILVVDDEEGIRELLALTLESIVDCKLDEAQDGEEAVGLLKEKKYDVVVCDYNMPNLNGGGVYEFMLQNSVPGKFILCSSDKPGELPEFKDDRLLYGFIEKPNVFKTLEEMFEKIEKESSSIEKTESHTYTPIGIKLLSDLGKAPVDLFIKISSDKYIKTYRAGDDFDERDFAKYHSRNIKKMYALNLDVRATIDLIQNNILEELKNDSFASVQVAVSVHEMMTNTAKEVGFNDTLAFAVKAQADHALKILKSSKPLSSLLKRLMKNQSTYLSKHSLLLALVSTSLAKQMSWTSDLISSKLIISSLLHDVYLPFDYENESQALKSAQGEDFLEHPRKVYDVLTSIKEVPADVGQIILEQHAVGEELGGFPQKTLSKVSPLGRLFGFSHFIVDICFEVQKEGQIQDVEKVWTCLEEIAETSSYYKKLFTVAKEVKLFK